MASSTSKLTLAAFFHPKRNRFLINLGSTMLFASLEKKEAQHKLCLDKKQLNNSLQTARQFSQNSSSSAVK